MSSLRVPGNLHRAQSQKTVLTSLRRDFKPAVQTVGGLHTDKLVPGVPYFRICKAGLRSGIPQERRTHVLLLDAYPTTPHDIHKLQNRRDMHEGVDHLAFKAGRSHLHRSYVTLYFVYIFYPVQSYNLTLFGISHPEIGVKSNFTGDRHGFEILDHQRHLQSLSNCNGEVQSEAIRPNLRRRVGTFNGKGYFCPPIGEIFRRFYIPQPCSDKTVQRKVLSPFVFTEPGETDRDSTANWRALLEKAVRTQPQQVFFASGGKTYDMCPVHIDRTRCMAIPHTQEWKPTCSFFGTYILRQRTAQMVANLNHFLS